MKFMKITVCIGSSCHVKGSRLVVEELQRLIAEHKLGDMVDLGGMFCMGQCHKGVSVKVNDQDFSVTPDDVEAFFQENVLSKLNA